MESKTTSPMTPQESEYSLIGSIEQTFSQYQNYIALVQDKSTITYYHLGQLVNFARVNLRANAPQTWHGERPVVAIIAHRSFDLIIGLLAIWLEGYVSLALNPALSDKRLVSEINNAQAFVILSDHEIQARVNQFTKELATVKQNNIHSIQELQQKNLRTTTTSPVDHPKTHSLYIAYSSGSTGKPKALLNTQKALQLAIDASIHDLDLKPSINVLLRSSTDFDGFYLEIMMTLMSGATLIMPGSDYINFSNYERICRDFKVHVAILTPTLALSIRSENTELKTLVLVGEKPSTVQIKRLLGAGLKVINGYGLVQDGVCTTMHSCSLNDDFTDGVSIGARAIPGKKLFIIDERGKLITTGSGQLCIDSDGLAEGYYVRGSVQQYPAGNEENLRDWTAAGFTTYHINNENKRIYKTGEKVVMKNNLFYVMGRLDNQFQIAGKTVLPEPIEDKIKSILKEKLGIESPEVYVGPYMAYDKTRMQTCIFTHSQPGLDTLTYQSICEHLDDLYPSRVFLKIVDNFDVILTNNKKLNRKFIANLLLDNLHDKNKITQLSYCDKLVTSENNIMKRISREVASLSGIDERMVLPIDTVLKYLGIQSDDVVRLIKRLEDHYTLSLPLWRLPIELTIESLAGHIANGLIYQKTLSALNKKQMEKPRALAFFVHPVTGVTMDYEKSELIGQLQACNIASVFCRAPLMIDDQSTLIDAFELGPPATLTQQADYLATAIGEQAGHTPIYLIGWSFGGTLASEVAERLVNRKHKVLTTVIIDSIAPQATAHQKPDAVNKFWGVTYAVTEELLSKHTPLMEYLKPKNRPNCNEPLAQQINNIADKIIRLASEYKGPFNHQYFNNKINTIRFCVLSWLEYSRTTPFDLTNVHLFTCQNDGGANNPFHSDATKWRSFCPTIQHTHLDSASHFDVMNNAQFIQLMSRLIESHHVEQKQIVFSSEKKIIGHLPAPCHFVGRKQELDTLTNWMKSARGIEFFNLVGLGGAGKTQLLVYFLKKHTSHFPGKTYVLNAESHVSLYASYRSIATHLQIETDTSNLPQLIHDVFQKGLERWSLIVDNVKDIDVLRTFNILDLEECKDSGCMVFFLSRQPIVLSRMSGHYLKVDALTSDECTKYIQEMTPKENTEQSENIAALARELSFFPLAVSQACGYINSRTLLATEQYTVREYLRDYKQKRQEMNEIKILDNSEFKYSIAVTWQMSQDLIEQILEKNQQRLSVMIRYLSYLDPDFINPTFLSFIAQRLSIVNPNAGLNFYLETLSSYCVLNTEKNKSESREFSMHRLLQDMIFDRLPLEAQISCLNRILTLLKSTDDAHFNEYSHRFADRYIRDDELGNFQNIRNQYPFFSAIFEQTDVGHTGRLPNNKELAVRNVLDDDLPLIACVDRMLDRSLDMMNQCMLILKSDPKKIKLILPSFITIMRTACDLFESVREAYQAMSLTTRSSYAIVKIAEFLSDMLRDDQIRTTLIELFDHLDNSLTNDLRFVVLKFMTTLTNITNNPGMIFLAKALLTADSNFESLRKYLIEYYDIVAYQLRSSLYLVCNQPKEALDFAVKWVDKLPGKENTWRHYIDICCTTLDYQKLLNILEDPRNPLHANKTAVRCIIYYQMGNYIDLFVLCDELLNQSGTPLVHDYLDCVDPNIRALLRSSDINCQVFALYYRSLTCLIINEHTTAIDDAQKLLSIARAKESIAITNLCIALASTPTLENIYNEASELASLLDVQQIEGGIIQEQPTESTTVTQDEMLGFLSLLAMPSQLGQQYLPNIFSELLQGTEQSNQIPEARTDPRLDIRHTILSNTCTIENQTVVIHVDCIATAQSLYTSLQAFDEQWPDTSGALVVDGYHEFIQSQTNAAIIISPQLYNTILDDPLAYEELFNQSTQLNHHGF